MVMRRVESWGRRSREAHDWQPLHDRDGVAAAIRGRRGLVHGLGRSYGDVALNAGGTLWSARGLDRFIAFDDETGRIACEAGVTLQEIVARVLPRGWFLPVTPGTQFVTVGGAIANDVHGKSHHGWGSFGEHVERLTLVRTDGRTIECGPGLQPEWFGATVGGMGLTGAIVAATLRLRRVPGSWMDTETLVFTSLAEFLDLSARSVADWDYSVAWIDCLATRGDLLRGLFFRGNHADDPRPAPPARTLRWPFTPPVSLVNPLSLRAFNALYFHRQRRLAGRPRRTGYLPFFYPLDGVSGWNRMYGPRGFHQYQCVVPTAVQAEATRELLGLIAASGTGSFLGVLKTFGSRPAAGLMSFAMPGVTLALDFPHRGAETLRLFERMNAVVAAAGGRLYAAKDDCMPRELFERGYPALPEFRRFRDPGMSSQLSRRLLGD